jgi:hypothetical protein
MAKYLISVHDGTSTGCSLRSACSWSAWTPSRSQQRETLSIAGLSRLPRDRPGDPNRNQRSGGESWEGSVAVPMYEVVLRAGDRDRVRITDHPLNVGDRLELDGQMWEVHSAEAPESPEVDARFILRLADGGFRL